MTAASNSNFAISRGWHSEPHEIKTVSGGFYYMMYVVNKLGYVQVYAQRDSDGGSLMTILNAIHNGRMYHRRYDKFYSKRYATTLSNRFIKEINKQP